MSHFTERARLEGLAVLLDRSDINTDEIIPGRYLTELDRSILGQNVLEGYRAPDAGGLVALKGGRCIALVARKNLGCGSSREQAVWALKDRGIRVCVAESFARIFRQNLLNNGVLPVELSEPGVSRIFEFGARSAVQVRVDGAPEFRLHVSAGGREESFSFSLPPFDQALFDAGGLLAWIEARSRG